MPYSQTTNLSPIMENEKSLLLAGFSYSEVAKKTGANIGTIKERNRLIYRLSLRDCFRSRIEKDGLKCRYNGGDAFGYWFSGYFDGEGCLTVFYREHRGSPDRRVGIQISCRYDDADVIRNIQNILGGLVWQSKAKGATNEAFNWRMEKVSDLAEIILPVFDTYSLRSKKRIEYQIWRTLVINQYINTLGGTSTRVGATKEENATFKSSLERIRKIRHPFRF